MRTGGQSVIVTGGLRGIGLGITRRFLGDGASVVCAARGGQGFQALVDEYGERVGFESVDIAEPDSVRRMVNRSIDAFGSVDVLVANAGIHADGLVSSIDQNAWGQVLDVNVKGTFNCIQQVAGHMVSRGRGSIVTISSIMGRHPALGASAYCASKAAIEMLTQVSALELGSKGVRVNCVAPGFIEAGMGVRLTANDKVWQAYRKSMALGRMGDSSEVAAAVAFLAGPESSYVNGHVLEVSGGIRWA